MEKLCGNAKEIIEEQKVIKSYKLQVASCKLQSRFLTSVLCGSELLLFRVSNLFDSRLSRPYLDIP